MALARWQASIVDEEGNVVPDAEITVTLEATGATVPLYSDRAGASVLGNPFNADGDGFAAFHAPGGAYRIDAVSGAFTRTWRYVAIGTAAESDLPLGGYGAREVEAAGDVEVLPTDVVLIINKTVGAATTVILPPAADRGGVPVIIKDGKGDANSNPITPAFADSPAELIDGQAASVFQITTPRGWARFDPLPDGSGYFTLGNQL